MGGDGSGKVATCFVTVGSTRFDKLVNWVLSDKVVAALAEHGYGRLVVQAGASQLDSAELRTLFKWDTLGERERSGATKIGSLQVVVFRYAPSIEQDMASADLVIGHAGAGTVLEALALHRRLIVAVNDTLADNHQTELADRLAEGRHLVLAGSDEDGLVKAIEKATTRDLQPWEAPSLQPVVDSIRGMLGLVA